jgi:hypothetical protein
MEYELTIVVLVMVLDSIVAMEDIFAYFFSWKVAWRFSNSSSFSTNSCCS